MRFRVIAPVLLLTLSASPTLVQAQQWKFCVTGDSRSVAASVDNGVNQAMLAEIAGAIVAEDPSFLLFSGDLVYGSSTAAGLQSQLTTWMTVMQVVYNAGISVYAVRGNHDDDFKSAWDAVFTGSYAMPQNGPAGEENVTFSFAHQNALIVGTDQYASHPYRVNQTWLDQQFAANVRPLVFVFGHNPAYEVQHTDCLNDYPANRNAFWNSLGAEGGRVYFCGHDHLINHLRAQDSAANWIHQFVLGTAGAPYSFYDGIVETGAEELYSSSVWGAFEYGCDGYGLVEIDGLDVTISVKERTEQYGVFATSHTFSYTAPGPAVPADEDFDGDVDGFDFLTFSDCYNGSNQPARPGCLNVLADIDGDDDVDGFDFLTFSNCYNGSNMPPRCP